MTKTTFLGLGQHHHVLAVNETHLNFEQDFINSDTRRQKFSTNPLFDVFDKKNWIKKI